MGGCAVTYKFVDIESGESIGDFACGQGADKGDKGVYKAITGAIKYVYMKTFNIPTGDDPEKNDRKPEKKASTPTQELPTVNVDDDLDDDLGL